MSTTLVPPKPPALPTPPASSIHPALWMPSRFSPSLSGTEDFPSHADWLLKLVDLVWRLSDGSKIDLDPWQRWLLRHMLECYPEGHPKAGQLRYRRVVVSMARQNGKSVLGAILGLYGLIRESGALVIGIASSAEQARIIYSRLLMVINKNQKLAKRFGRLTETRGISGKDGSRYEIKAAKSAAVQGLDVSVGLADELHIMKSELWSDLVNGTAARKNGIVVGITTAGDDTSTLLKDLYDQITSDPDERFGYFVWEAEEADLPKDDELLKKYIIQANPAIACGRMDLDTIVSDLRGMPEPDAIRYRLNRFVSSSNSFVQLHEWLACGADQLPQAVRPTFTIDRTPDWSHASIVATWKDGDKTYTQLVASIAKPTLEKLADLCVELSVHEPQLYVADNYTLKSLVEDLKGRGLPARGANLADVTSGSSLFYAKVVQRLILHGNDDLLTVQIGKTIRKNAGDGFRISRQTSSAEIDAVMATMMGVYFVEIARDIGLQLF